MQIAAKGEPRRRVSVQDLGMYELYFYAPVAEQAILLEEARLDSVRVRAGQRWSREMVELTRAYRQAVEQVLSEEGLAARSALRAVTTLRARLVELHRAVEIALDASIARGHLWDDDGDREAAERLDRALLDALGDARAEVRRQLQLTALPQALLADISVEEG